MNHVNKRRSLKNLSKFLIVLLFGNQAAHSEAIFLRCEGVRTMTSSSENSKKAYNINFVKVDQNKQLFRHTPQGGYDFHIDLCSSEYTCKFTENYYSSFSRKVSSGVETNESFFINRKDGTYRQSFAQSYILKNEYNYAVASEEGSCKAISDPFLDTRKNQF